MPSGRASPTSSPKEKQRYGARCAVVAIDAAAKKATLASGDVVEYESLLTTMPLDLTLAAAEGARGSCPRASLRSSSHIIGIGIRGKSPHGTSAGSTTRRTTAPFTGRLFFRITQRKTAPTTDGRAAHALPVGLEGKKEASLPPRTAVATTARNRRLRVLTWSLMFEVSESRSSPWT